MALTNDVYRFFRLQQRRWERSFGRTHSRAGRENREDERAKPRSRKDRRKRVQTRGRRGSILVALIYLAVATVLAAHFSGKRPLRMLSGGPGSANTGVGFLKFFDLRRFFNHHHRGTPEKKITYVEPTAPRVPALDPVAAHVVDTLPKEAPPEKNRLPVSSRETAEVVSEDVEAQKPTLLVALNEKKVETDETEAPPAAPSKKASSSTTSDEVDSVGEDELTSGSKEPPSRNAESSGKTAAAADDPPKKQEGFRSMADDMSSRRCYLSGVTEDTLCVHTPLCVRHTGIVYIAETLKCASYSNVHGILGSVSTRRCVEIETENEQRAEIVDPEHKGKDWMETLQRDDKIQWYEGETVFLSLSEKSRSVAHYSQRIFFLHHVLLHPDRYGLGRISNVVIVAHDEVVRKIKFRKSWHFGLLAAIVHPNKPIFKHQQMKTLIGEGVPAPGAVRVFIPSGFENLAKGRQVPCFRRATIPSALHSQYLLTQEKYPGIASHGIESTKHDDSVHAAAHRRGKFFDGAMFRKQVFASLDLDDPPLRKHLVYLHRPKGRVLSTAGQKRLEDAMKEVAAEVEYEYEYIDLAGLSFSDQVDALSKTSIAVGVHGMQLMSSMFMPADGALIEIFPYRFWHDLYANGCGSGLSYQSMSLSEGKDFAGLDKFKAGLEACVTYNKDCRMWYRSDDRELEVSEGDAKEVQRMVRQAAANTK